MAPPPPEHPLTGLEQARGVGEKAYDASAFVRPKQHAEGGAFSHGQRLRGAGGKGQAKQRSRFPGLDQRGIHVIGSAENGLDWRVFNEAHEPIPYAEARSMEIARQAERVSSRR